MIEKTDQKNKNKTIVSGILLWAFSAICIATLIINGVNAIKEVTNYPNNLAGFLALLGIYALL